MSRLLPRPLLIVVITVLLVAVPGPVLYMLFASVSSDVSVASGAFLPTELHLDNYLKVWTTVDLGTGLANSVIICGAVAVVCAFLAAATATCWCATSSRAAFLLGWNDVLFASVLTNPETRTAAVALQVFGATQEGGAVPLYGQMMAASLICAVPVVGL